MSFRTDYNACKVKAYNNLLRYITVFTSYHEIIFQLAVLKRK